MKKKYLEKNVKSIDLFFESENTYVNIDVNSITYINIGKITETREFNLKHGMLLYSNCNYFAITINDHTIDKSTINKLSNYKDLIYVCFNFESGYKELMHIPYKPYSFKLNGTDITVNTLQNTLCNKKTGINICVGNEGN